MIDISERIKDFKPGTPITKEQFTPDLQNDIMRSALNLPIERPVNTQVVDDNHVIVSKDQVERLNHYETVFSAPGVADAARRIIMGDMTSPQEMRSQVNPAPNQNAFINQSATPSPGMTPAPAQNAQHNINNQTPQNDAGSNDLFNAVFGVPSNTPSPQVNATPHVNAQQIPQNETPRNDHVVNENLQRAPVQGDDPVVSNYRDSIYSTAIKHGLNPAEVMGFINELSPEKVVEIFKRTRSAQESSTPNNTLNLAEEPNPRGPVKVYHGVMGGYGTDHYDRFKV